jgi:beta propeller repeat protein
MKAPLPLGRFRRAALLALCFVTATFLLPRFSRAEDVCARVKIEIIQELTFERVAFDAKMKITNGLDTALEGIRVDVSLTTKDGADVSDIFYMRVSSMDGINSVDGSGTVAANSAGEIHWLIIPSPGAGGEDPEGIRYLAGATLSYTAGGNTETMEVEPDEILVKPQPLLILDYFLPRNVFGDNPYTSETEASVPYDLGVRVQNTGHGVATDLKIDSGQPKIIDNEMGLLVDFRILGSSVNGETVSPSLKVNFGDIAPQTSGMARWQMVSSLTGNFVEFDATFSHADELGGELTSLIEDVKTHFLERNVMVDLPGRDTLTDFLGEDAGVYKVWESDNLTNPVANVSATSTLTHQGGGLYIFQVPLANEYLFAQKTEPTQGRVPIAGVFRSDGKAIKPENYWVKRVRASQGAEDVYLCLFDVQTTGTYTVTYDYNQTPDTTPPVSTLSPGTPGIAGDPVFVTADTPLLFLSEDPESGVKDMKFNVDQGLSGPWEAVVNPFKFSQRPALAEGAHTLHFYAVNTRDIEESPKSVAVRLDNSAPVNLEIAASPAVFVPGAPEDSGLARAAQITVDFDDAVPRGTALVEIAQGTGVFSSLPLARSYTLEVAPGQGGSVAWDGKNVPGALQPPGMYSVRFTANDGLGHAAISSILQVEIQAYLDDAATASGAGEQMFPDVYGQTIVWQDNRDGNWEIYKYESGQAVNITSQSAAQEEPAISADYIVWQDYRNGNWDIYYYKRATQTTAGLTISGDQKNPDVSGNRVVYQDNQSGNYEIYACDLSAGTPAPVRLTDGNERDQINPSISGNLVAYEDYRFGKPEIYIYDSLPSGVLRRVTVQEDTYQTHPVVNGTLVLWTDTRNGQNDIYSYNTATLEERALTRGIKDDAQAAADGTRMAYVQFAWADNPDISWGGSANGISAPLVVHEARQEEPALSGNLLVWQDNRIGRWQIYEATVTRDDVTLAVEPGLNLLAAPAEITGAQATDTAFELLSDLNGRGMGVTRLAQVDPATGAYRTALWESGAPAGTDYSLTARSTLAVHATGRGALGVPELAAEPALALARGFNPLGMAAVPDGLTAWTMLRSIGLANARSLRAYDTRTGQFLTVTVEARDDGQGGAQYLLRGRDFPLTRGQGLLLYMVRPVASWRP